MIKLLRTDANNPDFKELIILLDAGLAISDREDHQFYIQFNKTDEIRYVIVAYENSKAVACGAIKKYDENTMEVKRMFTSTESRKKNESLQFGLLVNISSDYFSLDLNCN